MYKYVLIIIMCFCGFACKQDQKNKKKDLISPAATEATTPLYLNYLDRYQFDAPDEIIKLPKELNEISGLSFINDSIIAAICDNRPNLYFINLNTRQIINKVFVSQQGDFEDVTVCGNDAFILQSNGVLWKVANMSNPENISSDTFKLEQPFELEGLCHNDTCDTLFIAAKYWHLDKHEGELPVYAYSIKSRELTENPLFNIPVSLGSANEKKPFHTSGILRLGNPAYWITISTNNKYIAQLNSNGKKDTMMMLNEELFNQPEGISMDKNGTIFIANESKSEKDKPTLLKFIRKL